MTGNYSRKGISASRLDTSLWPMPDVSGWPQREQAYFIKLKSLIEDYARGMSMNRRLLQEGIPWQTLLRKFSHCVTLKADGQVVGWNALIPYKRVSPFKRVAPPIKAGRSDQGGLSGVLNAFLRANPEISNSLNEYLWRAATRKQGSEAGIRLTSVHEYFIHIVRKHGFAEDAWPLNTVTQAESSIRRYAKRFIRENYDDIVAHQFGRTAAAKARTGTGYATRLRSTLPLDVVELDEHSVDFIGSIGIKTPDGMRWVEMRRATIILLADRKGCVLSFKVTFRREANTDDILDVLAIAFGEAPDVGYYTSTYDHLKGALPVSLGGSLARCAFNLLEVDGALTHLADELVNRAQRRGGFDINLGPVGRFERRPIVEGIFKKIEGRGFHRLQNTTGTGPSDPRRQNAEAKARATKVPIDEILDLIRAEIKSQNVHEGNGNFGRSHLNRYKDLLLDTDGTGFIFPVLPARVDGEPTLDISIRKLTVRGNINTGERPHVNFEGESYFGREISERWDLLKTKVVAHIDRLDIRSIRLYEPDGVFIGTVVVGSRWREYAHSKEERKYINAMVRDLKRERRYEDDPINLYLEALGSSASGKNGASKDRRRDVHTFEAERQRLILERSKASASSLMDSVIREVRLDMETVDEDHIEENLPELRCLNGDENV